MGQFVHLAAILVMGASLAILAACQDNASRSQSAAPQRDDAQVIQEAIGVGKGASATPLLGDVEMVGTVVASGNELLIATNEGNFAVSSLLTPVDLSGMEGKTVKVTATLIPGVEREDGSQVIEILKISTIE